MDDALKPMSKLGHDAKLTRAKDMRSRAHYAGLDELREAVMMFKFKAGDQWTDEEKYALEAQNRTPRVWNKIHVACELVSGVLSQNPVKIKMSPVDKTDGFLAEVMEILVDWVEENQTNSEELELEAFDDSVVCGKGHNTIDIQPRPENPTEVQILQECPSVRQVKKDPSSKASDYSDARYLIVEKWVSLEDFAIRYPDFKNKINDIFAGAGENLQYSSWEDTEHEDTLDDIDIETDYYDFENKRVLICQLEYFENYTRYYHNTPDDPSNVREIDPKQASLFPKDEIIKTPAKKVKWLHFTNDFILYDDDSPVYPDGFSTIPSFAYTDKSKTNISHYGIVKLMIDPQVQANHFGMQTIKQMTSQGTGVVAEEGAFVDNEQAQASWSQPDEITWANEGKLDKWKEKTSLDFPVATVQLQELQNDAMNKITGLNPNMMGLEGSKQEAGVTVRLRQQQGLTIINKLFQNHKRMRKNLFKIKIYLIMKYMPDWQISKILGESDRFVVKDGVVFDKEFQKVAPVRAMRDMKYNLKYEDAPGNITKMMSELAIFLDMVSKNFPVDPVAVIDRLDISETAKERWKKYIEESKQSQQKMQELEMGMKQAEGAAKAEGMTGKLQNENGKLQLANQRLKYDSMLKERELEDKRVKDEFEAKIKESEEKRKRAEVVLKYKTLGEAQKENQRKFYLDLSEDERANLDHDLKIMGVIDGEISKKETVEAGV